MLTADIQRLLLVWLVLFLFLAPVPIECATSFEENWFKSFRNFFRDTPSSSPLLLNHTNNNVNVDVKQLRERLTSVRKELQESQLLCAEYSRRQEQYKECIRDLRKQLKLTKRSQGKKGIQKFFAWLVDLWKNEDEVRIQ